MLKVGDTPELRAAVLAMKGVDKTVRSRISKATVGTMGPEWKSLVMGKAHTSWDKRIIVPGTRIAGGNPPTAVAANSRRKVGRLIPSENWRGFEFGADRNAFSRYSRRSSKGTVHTVERRTMRHMPPRAPKGRIVYPAFAEIAPRMVSLWVQIIVKTVHDAAEGKG